MNKIVFAALLAVCSATNAAEATGATGAIAGVAEANAQIVVTELATGKLIGVMAKCDGSYRADGLAPGRYQIVQGGPHHATRELSVNAGKASEVDLAPASRRTSSCAAQEAISKATDSAAMPSSRPR